MINKKDCFAYANVDNEDVCSAIGTNTCYECRFFKTKEQNEEQTAKAPWIKIVKGRVQRLNKEFGGILNV